MSADKVVAVCLSATAHHPQVPEKLYGRRGLLTVVKNPGSVKPGDTGRSSKRDPSSRGAR